MPVHEHTLPLRIFHIGDLHVTRPGLQNHCDLSRIVDDVNVNVAGAIDFVFLPGDNADDGSIDQFNLVSREISRLRAPWRVIPGDHDFKPHSLENFYQSLGCPQLPTAEEIRGCVCLFLDVVSKGGGGPDFQLGRDQIDWLRDQLAAAKNGGKTAAIFMHVYPADLGTEATDVAALIDQSPAVLVDMGHTHYNELSNDGHTIYAATRSTGQIEEGDVGSAFLAIDGGVVSWRFKPLASSWPFVMITSPADRRLVVDDSTSDPVDHRDVRASVWGAKPIVTADVQIDDGDWLPMTIGPCGMLEANVCIPRAQCRLSVRVVDQVGGIDTDTIEIDPTSRRDNRFFGGSDAGSIGAWPGRHLLGTQLGPNRNGRKW